MSVKKMVKDELESIYIEDEELDVVINYLKELRHKYSLSHTNIRIEEVSDYSNSHHFALFGMRIETDDEYIMRVRQYLMYEGVTMNAFMNLNPLTDYIEDLDDGNGNYENICLKCGTFFIGYKRRSWCKKCFTDKILSYAGE